MKIKRRAFMALGLAAALAGCSVGKDLPAATKAIDQFHADLNAGNIVKLIQQSGPELIGKDPVRTSNLFLAVHRKLGVFQRGKVQGWNENLTTSGHFLAINYAATYAKGSATEQFVYRIGKARPILVGYNINAEALILN